VSAARLAELIRELQPCVVLTGAGVSTESGIPDFRSRTGLWAQYDPLEYATIQAFRRDPVKVWDFYAKRLAVLTEARPNPGHDALAELERRGLVRAVVTQNIDRLHELAGSRQLVEVHGSVRTSSCPSCGERVPLEEVVRLLESAPAPPCPRCSTILKPDVVMFGEAMPEAETERAFQLAREAALLLVVGSSLEVYPVAALPQ
jgi:NAD-dependent deacetylase